jgi:rubrerythrin
MEFASFDEILDYAIAKEEEAESLYTALADKVSRPEIRQAFLAFAEEERAHRDRLLRVKAGELPVLTEGGARGFGLAEQLVDPEPTANMTYSEALLFAIKSEKEALSLYTRMAALTQEQSLSELFRSLAQEEAAHKQRFEREYDEHVLDGR